MTSALSFRSFNDVSSFKKIHRKKRMWSGKSWKGNVLHIAYYFKKDSESIRGKTITQCLSCNVLYIAYYFKTKYESLKAKKILAQFLCFSNLFVC